MVKLMDKRGVELPINTLVVIILVVIVLLVVGFFFLGGSSKLSESIRNIFFKSTAGTDLSLAIEICEQRCEQAKSMPALIRSRSAYCTDPFSLDLDNDGEADYYEEGDKRVTNKYYCGGSTLGVGCDLGDVKDCIRSDVTSFAGPI